MARTATSGMGSTGVPTDASTTPPGNASAVSFRADSRSCGYGGGTNPLPRSPIVRSVTAHRLNRSRSGHELVDARRHRFGEPGTHARPRVVVHLDQHLTVAMQRGEHVAALVRHEELVDGRERAQ